MTKTNGFELKKFWGTSEPWWPKDGFVDGDSYIVNGIEVGEEFEPDLCADGDLIVINGGVICSNEIDDFGKDLEATFRKWRKSLTTATVIIEVDLTKQDELKETLKKFGAKIIK